MITHEEQKVSLESTDTGGTSRVRLQTFRRSFEEICAGEAPWIPLGKFMHQFFGCFSHLRPELVEESIEVPENCSPEQFQWAVFVLHRWNICAKSTISPVQNGRWTFGTL